MLCAASSSARALLFEADKNRRLVDSDLLRFFVGAAISCSCLLAVPLARFHRREVFIAQEQFKPRSFLSQAAVDNLLVWRNFSTKGPPREPSRTLARPAIHGACGARRIGHHKLGLSAAAAPRGNEIECRMVGVARSVGDDSSKVAQGVSSRLTPECRGPARPRKLYQNGQPDRLWSAAQNVIHSCPRSRTSPDQGFTLLRGRASSASSMPSAASTRQRSSAKQPTRIFAFSSRSSDPKTSCYPWMWKKAGHPALARVPGFVEVPEDLAWVNGIGDVGYELFLPRRKTALE